MTHTPRPWIVSGFTIIAKGGTDEEPCWVAECNHDLQWHPAIDGEANARLIAAAPDLLEAIQGLFEHCAMVHKHWGDACNRKEANSAITRAKEAIAKATGEEATE